MLHKIFLTLLVILLGMVNVFAKPLSDFSVEEQGAIQTLHADAVSKGEEAIILGNGTVNTAALADSNSAAASAATAGTTQGTSSVGAPGNCDFDPASSSATIGAALEKCVGGTDLVQTGDLTVSGGFKTVIIGWIQTLAGFFALGAIFAIAYGALMMTLSAGEDEKLKKAKDIIKWGIIGFIGVISAGFLIALVVNVIYTIGS